MSDLIGVVELMAVADDESSDTPPLPPVTERRSLRRAASIPLELVASVVGVSSATLLRVERGSRLRSHRQERRYRRVLGLLRRRLEQRDPSALAAEMTA